MYKCIIEEQNGQMANKLKTIRAVPKIFIEKNLCNMLHNPYVAIISIADSDDSHVLPQDTSNIIRLTFDDIIPTVEYRLVDRIMFNEEHAVKIINFLNDIKNNDTISALIINCHAGVSRSGAVAKFARKFLDFPCKLFHKENKTIYPNKHVLKMLYLTWKNKDICPISTNKISGSCP
jgi:predicted protein tyrosine phosphatase